jgi:hypothetical protein
MAEIMMKYLPNDVFGIVASGFLNSITNAWKALFSGSQSQLFDQIYSRISDSKIEQSFWNSKPLESQQAKRHDANLILNELKKWKTDIRLRKLWMLSRDPSVDRVLVTLRSLHVLSESEKFVPLYGDPLLSNFSEDLAKAKNISDFKGRIGEILSKVKFNPKRSKSSSSTNFGIFDSKGNIADNNTSTLSPDEPLGLIGYSLDPSSTYRLAIIPPDGDNNNRYVLLKLKPQQTGQHIYIAAETRMLPSFNPSLITNGTGYKLTITEEPENKKDNPYSDEYTINVKPREFWFTEKDEKGRLGWDYLLYYSLLETPELSQLFQFAFDTVPEDRKTTLSGVIASAVFPERLDPTSSSQWLRSSLFISKLMSITWKQNIYFISITFQDFYIRNTNTCLRTIS